MSLKIKTNNQKSYIDKKEYSYQPVIYQAPTDMDFHYYDEEGNLQIKAKCTLIRSLDELKEYAIKCTGKPVGFDTETTGLTFGEDKIVGFSLALNGLEGVYIPIRHQIRREVTKKKVNKLDENGFPVLTKTGRVSQQTVITYDYFESPYNLPAKEALDILYGLMKLAKVSYIHNADFDLNMLRQEGYDITQVHTYDTMILPYIYDAEGRGIAGLKDLEKRLLGRTVPDFKKALDGEECFQYTDPTKSYEYACYDAMATFAIYNKLKPMVSHLLSQYKEIISLDGKRYNILKADNQLIRAFADYYDHCKLTIDKDNAKKYKEKLIKDLAELNDKIYSFFGKGEFNLSKSSKEFKQVMMSKHLVTGAYTETGAVAYGDSGIKEFNRHLNRMKMLVIPILKDIGFENSKIDKKELRMIGVHISNFLKFFGSPYFKISDGVNYTEVRSLEGYKLSKEEFDTQFTEMYKKECEKFEILKAIKEQGSMMKALNSYIDKLAQTDECRMHYRLFGTASGRLSSGNGSKNSKKKNHYYIDLNAQNLTKPKPAFYEAIKDDAPNSILGWSFKEVPDKYAQEHLEDKYIVEGFKQETNIRSAIKTPPLVQQVNKLPIEVLNNPQDITEEEVFEIELDNGKSIKGTKSSIYHVLDEGVETYLTLEEIMRQDNIEIIED